MIIEELPELQEFVHNTITQIALGVESANNVLISNMKKNYKGNNVPYSKIPRKTTNIEFDICVSTNNKETKKEEGGLKIKVVSGGIEKMDSTENIIQNRIKFAVPVSLHPLEYHD